MSEIDALLGELTQQSTVTNLTYVGFPPIPEAEVPPCGNYFICNRSREWIRDPKWERPTDWLTMNSLAGRVL